MIDEHVKLSNQTHLSYEESYELASRLLNAQLSTPIIADILRLLHDNHETTDEILGFIHAMRKAMTPVPLNQDTLIDICGTGGSLSNRFNVSTCVALILGQLHYNVAKHGNRGSKQPNGSFDFLDAINIPYELTATQHQAMMDRFNCTFLFARHYHPAVKHAAEARRHLSTRSIFNLIGPFCNPASPNTQIIGTPSKAIAQQLFDVGMQLDYKTFAIITSDIGLDECSTVGHSTIYISNNGENPKELTINPREYNIQHKIEDIMGGTSTKNAMVFMDILSKRLVDHPITELIALNAAVIMHIIDDNNSIQANIKQIKRVIESGELLSYVQQYQMFRA